MSKINLYKVSTLSCPVLNIPWNKTCMTNGHFMSENRKWQESIIFENCESRSLWKSQSRHYHTCTEEALNHEYASAPIVPNFEQAMISTHTVYKWCGNQIERLWLSFVADNLTRESCEIKVLWNIQLNRSTKWINKFLNKLISDSTLMCTLMLNYAFSFVDTNVRYVYRS